MRGGIVLLHGGVVVFKLRPCVFSELLAVCFETDRHVARLLWAILHDCGSL
jgi:hypothetical protein